jgi:MOSC domain-containing protein YiiM
VSAGIKILSVNVSEAKGIEKHPVPEVTVGALGIEGDAHRDVPKRHVSLLDRGIIDRFSSEASLGEIGYGAFGENITFLMDDALLPSPGDIIEISDVRLRVEIIGKECHGEGCSIYRRAGKCVMPSHGIFCSVLSGGKLVPGMKGRIIRL